MTTEGLLRTIALVAAWARADEEAVQLLIKDKGADLVADLIEFTLMVLSQNTDGHTTAYLDFLSEQALAIKVREAGR